MFIHFICLILLSPHHLLINLNKTINIYKSNEVHDEERTKMCSFAKCKNYEFFEVYSSELRSGMT